MKTAVNLLPMEYTQAIERRRRTRIALIAGLACAAAGLAWWKIAMVKLNPMVQRTQEIRKQIDAEKATAKSLEQSQALYKKLQAVQTLRDEVSEPIDTASIMELLSELMPPETGLTRLGITLPKLSEQKPAKAATGAPKEAPKPPAPIVVEMTGVSKSNADVMKCVGHMAEHPLFANVKLSNSKQMLDGKASLVGFQITMEIPVNRKFVIPATVNGTEATADVE